MATQSERTAKTRHQLIENAKVLFAKKGFAKVSTEELVGSCGLTRGSLYHHFKDKKDLFSAVVEEVQLKVTQSIERDAEKAVGLWEGIKAGCVTFINECGKDDVRQILLIDGMSVLGIKKWREIDERTGFASLKTGLKNCVDAGILREQPVEPLARLISGALNEAAIWLAEKPRSHKRRKELLSSLNQMLDALK